MSPYTNHPPVTSMSRSSRHDGRTLPPTSTLARPRASLTPNRRVWIPDVTEGFLPGWIKSQTGDESSQDASAEVVVAATGEVRQLPLYSLSPMNPPQFDGVEDIADLTHLNEASVINNLRQRYGAASIYVSRPRPYSVTIADGRPIPGAVIGIILECSLTLSLFLISLNPYRSLPIYTSRIVAQYRTRRREENVPHIFAVAERAWQQIGEERESQSILITCVGRWMSDATR